jgi:uncharacterized membrane protein YgcG
MKLKGFLLLAIVSALAAALWPAAGGAANFKGIVLANQRGTLLVASPAGVVRAVSGRAAVGSRVVFSGGHATVVGRASRAHVRGVVVRRIGTTLLISSNRHLLALHTGRVLAATAPTTTPPAAPGTVVSAQVAITNGQLDEQDETDVGQVASNSIMVTATITAVAAGSVTLDVQGQALTVPLPAGLTLPASLVGQTVTIQLSLAGNGDDQGDDDGGGNGGGNGNGGGGGDNGGGGGGDG